MRQTPINLPDQRCTWTPDPISPTAGIQEAIDALGRRGGRVYLPAGTYVLRRAVVPRDGVTLCGDGEATVLTAPPPRFVALASDAKAGSRSIVCRDEADIRPGDAVAVLDDERFMSHGTHATVQAASGKRVKLSVPIGRTLKVAANARAVLFAPAIFAREAAGFAVQSLTIQGPRGYRGPACDFTFSAIELVDCRRVRITDCSVHDWPSDGISVQGGCDVQVTQCQAHRCAGHGLHPGTNLGRSVWSHNISTHNGGDGFFFCAGVHHTVCANNVLNFNGRGIGGVGNGGDHHNIISGNIIVGSRRMGISATTGEEHVISGNIIMNNSRQKAGQFPGIVLTDFRRGLIQGNRLADDQKRKTQWAGIVEAGSSDQNVITGNLCMDMRQAVTIVGKRSVSENNVG